MLVAWLGCLFRLKSKKLPDHEAPNHFYLSAREVERGRNRPWNQSCLPARGLIV